MIYLSSFQFAPAAADARYIADQRCRWDTSYYPFGFFPQKKLAGLELEPLTILYGGNGSGKSTALNVMAEHLHLNRDTAHNSTRFFHDYVRLCSAHTLRPVPRQSRFICSDDVFDYMLNLRALNEGIDLRREQLFDEVVQRRTEKFQLHSMEDYEHLKQVSAARRMGKEAYARHNLMDNAPTASNGESALRYFTEHIQSDALYLLDEPENSLSPERQRELADFLAGSARFFGCQLVVSTHSPFLLAMEGAKIYDLDSSPAAVRPWTELGNVRAYYDFFQDHRQEFE